MHIHWILALSVLTVVAGSQRAPSAKVAAAPTPPAPAAKIAASPPTTASTGPEGPFVPWKGKLGVTRTVAEIMEYERAHPFEWDGTVREGPEAEEPDRTQLRQNPASPLVSQFPAPVPEKAPRDVSGSGGVISNPQTVGIAFNGPRLSESGFVPPDSCGAIGPTQVLACGNGRIKLFDRNGNLGALNASTDNFFSPVLGLSGTSDPQVKYDWTSGRWFVTIIDVATTSNSVYLAVSSGSVITNATSFTFYSFQQDLVLPPGDTGQFADYPKVGIDKNAVYIGVNIFGPGGVLFFGSTGFVVKKSSVLSGGPIEVTAFRALGTSTGSDGPFAPTGVDNPDPSATEGYFIGSSMASFGLLVLRRVTDPGGTPSVSGNLNLTVPATSSPASQPAQGSSNALDALDDRLFAAQIHKNRLTGVASLWTAHNILVNSGGVASGGNRNGSRWYQIGSLSGTPSLLQAGTLFDSAATNPKGFWIPSCSMTGQGHMALGASYAGNADRAGVAVAGRFSNDSLGTIQAPTLAAVSTSDYNAQTGTVQRWGDYSATFVDPNDDQTIWTFQEWCNASNSWCVRVTELRAPPPAAPASATPSSLPLGSSNVAVVLAGTSVAGSAFYDTEPGFNRLQASVSNPDVTVSSVTLDSPTQVTLHVSVSPTAATGPASVTVTNPDGQSATSIVGLVSVDGAQPGTPYCAGDGSTATGCPCGNTGLSGRGCDNSIATGGARLSATGSMSPDTVVMTSSGERPTSFSLLLQGPSTLANPVLYGDGIRCVTGSLKRLYAKNAAGGTFTAPQGGDPGIRARSAMLGDAIPSGATRYYAVVYRDPSTTFCAAPSGSTFNSSNGYVLVWP